MTAATAYPRPKAGNYLVVTSDGEADVWLEGDASMLDGKYPVAALLGDAMDLLYEMHPERQRPSS